MKNKTYSKEATVWMAEGLALYKAKKNGFGVSAEILKEVKGNGWFKTEKGWLNMTDRGAVEIEALLEADAKNRLTNAKTKATKAIAKIVMGEASDREFDNLFENGDGDLVVTFIIAKVKQNDTLRHAVADWHGGELIDGLPKAWIETYNRVMPTLI